MIPLLILIYCFSTLTNILHDLYANIHLNFNHPFITGILFTALVQSSSLSILLVCSLSHKLSLYQLFYFIMGANIGTCITLFITSYSFTPFIVLLLLLSLVLKKYDHLCFLLGLILYSLTLFKGNMYFHTSSYILDGFLTTLVIQSSSAYLTYLQSSYMHCSISMMNAFYSVLGSNIGTCITPLIGHIKSGKKALCALSFHFIYNIIGSLLFYMLIPLISFNFDIHLHIACFHLLFNVCTSIFMHIILNIISLFPLRYSLYD